jgi:hypothetical protein
MTIDYLKIRGPAEEIARSAIIAYYLEGSGADEAWISSQERTIRDNFADLVRAMGYRVEKIEEPAVETTEAA